MERLVSLALAILAVFALATVASSLEQVSTEPTIETDTTPTGVKTDAGGGASAGGTQGTDGGDRSEPTETAANDDSGANSAVPLWQVVTGLALFLVGSGIALYGLTRGEDDSGDDSEQRSPEPTAPSADRATLGGNVPATNDVYRAWAALCRTIPQDPTGQTPAAVANAAVEVGHEPTAVTALTDTFCAVRYGGSAPTAERERRARELAATLALPMEGEP